MEGKPVLYFLDPFGVDGLLVEDLPKLLAGEKNDVFAMFSDVGAKRLHAVLMTEGRDVDFEVAEVLATPSLFPEFMEEDAEAKRQEAERSNAALRATQQQAERILAEALATDAVELIAAVPYDERRSALVGLYMRRLLESGAKYVISMPVRDAANARVYQLVHASKSPVGLRTMKEAMSQALSGSTLPEESRTAIQAELRLDVREIVREIVRHFGGPSVHWTKGKDRSEDTVRRFLLESTPVFPWQFEEVKQELIREGFAEQRRPLVFGFPRPGRDLAP